MPRISEFYGIAIAMYYAEHGVPHFHAIYAGEMHRSRSTRARCSELEENWRRAREGQPLEPIAALP